MRVLFSCGNAPFLPTGYGGQGGLLLQALQGHQVTVLAWNLPPQLFQPFQLYTTEEILRLPMMKLIMDNSKDIDWTSITWFSNPYAQFPHPIVKNDINKMITLVKADLFISLQDIFMYTPGPFYCTSAVWMPMHFQPIEHPTVMALSDFDFQFPISGWGATLLSTLQDNKCMRHVEVVPHGRDITIFKPLYNDEKIKDKAETRKKFEIPEDAFVCLIVASNSEESGRKAFESQIQAFKLCTRKNKWLHIHSEITRAYDIPRILEMIGMFNRAPWIDWNDPRKRTLNDAYVYGEQVSITPQAQLNKITDEEMAAMYRMSDCLLSCTCSEGCGVPILEAQLCGIPVITNKTTAMWEETIFGYSVEPCQWIMRMDFNSGWWLPDSKKIGKVLDKEMPVFTEEIHKKIIKEFSNETVIKRWHEVLKKIENKENFLSEKRLMSIKIGKMIIQAKQIDFKVPQISFQKQIVDEYVQTTLLNY